MECCFYSVKTRTSLPVSEKNGMPNVNSTNGYSSPNSIGNPSRAYVTRSPHYQPSHFQQQQQQQQISFQAVPELRRIDDNVIRLPRGPDGTTGFMLKR